MIRIIQVEDTITFKGHTIPEVCASVSTAMYTSVNLLDKYGKQDNDFTYEDNVEDDYVTIKILKHDKIIDMIVENMFDILQDLVEDDNADKIEIVRTNIK